MERADQYRFPKHSYLPNGAVIEGIQQWSGGRRLYPERHLLHIYALAAFTLAFIGLASLAVPLRIVGDFLLVSLCPAAPTYRVHRRIEDSDNGKYQACKYPLASWKSMSSIALGE